MLAREGYFKFIMKNNLLKEILIASLIGVSGSCFAQAKSSTLIFGIETGGKFSIIPEKNLDIYDRYTFLRTAPYLEIKTAKNLYTGLNYELETGKVNGLRTTPLTGFGMHARYFFPLFKNNLALKDKLQVYAEAALIALDHVIDTSAVTGVRHLSDYSNLNTQIVAGGDFRLFNSLYLNVAVRPMFYTQGKSFQWSNKLGLEYHFGEKREKYVRTLGQPESEITNKAAMLDFSSFLNKFTLGSSLAYIIDVDNSGNPDQYKELTWNINAAVSITSDFDFGIAVLPIWIKKGQIMEKHLLTGFFTQYDFLRNFKGSRLFLETGYYRGNHCPCGDGDPYYYPDLSYIPIGGGYEAKLLKNASLYLDLSILFYQILTKIPEKKYAYGHYVVGLNYHLYP